MNRTVYVVIESPSETGVEIPVLVHQGVQDGSHRWIEERNRRCDEGLPPNIETGTEADRTVPTVSGNPAR